MPWAHQLETPLETPWAHQLELEEKVAMGAEEREGGREGAGEQARLHDGPQRTLSEQGSMRRQYRYNMM
jgi:hypothetical protein